MTENYEQWEKLTPDVYRKWIEDDQIVVYKVLDSNREAVTAWANGIRETYEHWDPSKLYLAAYDLSVVLALSPFARSKIRELVEIAQARNIRGAYALVLSNSMVTFALNLFVRRELDRINRNFVRQIFNDQEAAITWLKDYSEEQARQEPD